MCYQEFFVRSEKCQAKNARHAYVYMEFENYQYDSSIHICETTYLHNEAFVIISKGRTVRVFE